VRRRNLSIGPDERRRVIDMHRAIRDRVAEHDPAAAQQAMREHLDHVQATYGRHAPEL
jgi:DNA-binding GntR family transcriptional regulator